VAARLLDPRDFEFMLYELFVVESMTSRERYAEQNRETFDAAINTACLIAAVSDAYLNAAEYRPD
jgi:hypothetical protein